VDNVFPIAPVRQWVVTFPFDMRFRMAFDTELCTQVLRVVNSCISSWIRRRARDYLELQSVKGLQTGCVTFIQRWRSDLALNPHLHILFIDGVYIENDDEPPVFRAIPGPLRKDLEHVASRIAVRLRRIAGSEDSNSAVHELAEAEPLLAACGAASVQKRIATGARAGQRVRTVHVPTQDEKAAVGGLCAQVDGVNIHAGVRVPASDRGRLERLVRYVARSPIAANRLRVDDNGDVIYELKRVWSDGSVAVRLSPVEFLEKLAALVPTVPVSVPDSGPSAVYGPAVFSQTGGHHEGRVA
ncbi:MAG: transposase, partial [Gemmatimonadales bacterium]